MSLEEIEAVYDELLEKYEHLADDNMYYKEKIAEWTDAFDCIIDHRIDITEHPLSIKIIQIKDGYLALLSSN